MITSTVHYECKVASFNDPDMTNPQTPDKFYIYSIQRH